MSFDSEYFKNNFPKFELSYDNLLHKKVYSDIYLLIPKGVKVFSWFTYYKNKNLCVLLHLNNNNKITKVEEIVLCFDKSLSYGTILYGTYFKIGKSRYFSCEDIIQYKDDMMKETVYKDKLKIIKNIFDKELRQVLYTQDFVYFGIPIIGTNLNDLIENIPRLSYEVNGIQCRNWNKIKEKGLLLYKDIRIKDPIFRITANIEADIYTLHCQDRISSEYGYAGIPTYKLSVTMNKIFRKIKENSKLDLLEESDNEEEFEDISSDKFVDLKKYCYMTCIFNKKFKKWIPCKIVNEHKNIERTLLTKYELKNLEK